MENLLAVLGTLFFLLMVLAAAVEAILEVFRGTFERFGFTWAKSMVSLEDALKLASEFGPESSGLNTKLEAVVTTAKQLKAGGTERLAKLDAIRKDLLAFKGQVPPSSLAAKLSEEANLVKAALDANERFKINILRFAAAVVGCLLVATSQFYIFDILSSVPEAKQLLANLVGLKAPLINILVGGVAAAAGSGYWHDQIDRVRNIKSFVTDTRTLRF